MGGSSHPISGKKTAAKASIDGAAVLPARKRRLRYGALPRPADKIEVPYAKARDELRDKTCGDFTRWVIDTEAWQEVMVPLLDRVDRDWKAQRGGRGFAPRYDSHQLEWVHVYGAVCGLHSIAKTRNRLASDRGRQARQLLGFEMLRPYKAGPRQTMLRDGVPSEASLCRHRKRFPEAERVIAYRELFERITREHFEKFESMHEEARQLDLDGTPLLTSMTTPHSKKRKDGTVFTANPDEVTCPTGGWIPKDADGPDRGHHGSGWNAVTLATATGLPVAVEVTKLNDPERETGTRVIEQFGQRMRPLMDPDLVGVVTADGGFQSPHIRIAARKAGLVENMHLASHKSNDDPDANRTERDRTVLTIKGAPNWTSNGHREISCACGQGQVDRRFKMRDGQAVLRIEGSCPVCGPCSVTSGDWRKVPGKLVRASPKDQLHKRDLYFGNPLTFNDPIALSYGRARFGHQEGMHGAMATRFDLTGEKRRIPSQDHAEIRLLITYSAMHAIAMQQRRLAAAAEASRDASEIHAADDPPDLALAA